MDEFEARRPALEAELGEPVTIDGLSSSVKALFCPVNKGHGIYSVLGDQADHHKSGK